MDEQITPATLSAAFQPENKQTPPPVKLSGQPSLFPKKKVLRIIGVFLIVLGIFLLLSRIYLLLKNKNAGTNLNTAQTPGLATEIIPAKPIPNWETYTSPQGFSIQYEAPTIFNQEVTPNGELLTYYSNQTKESKSLEIEVSSQPSDFLKVKDLPQAKDANAKLEKIGANETVSVSLGPNQKQYFFLNNNTLYQFTVHLFSENSSTLLLQILSSVVF